MIALQYPDKTPAIRQRNKDREIFDPVRKKWVLLSPEEWVRQQFLLLLMEAHQYPASLVAVEKSFSLGALQKRCDILVYNRKQEPWMMIECKAESIPLDETVLEQLLRYNMSIPVQYLLITNGLQCMGWERGDDTVVSLEKIPVFPV
ncbi:MAG: type I restriction enzyme HsdR N-terminal domain-containing protein [Sphingomonadales bacterium]|nr:type I restriction enzyme HsdR N-terminal domain-containing protein [Sphingomonadales bacterium]